MKLLRLIFKYRKLAYSMVDLASEINDATRDGTIDKDERDRLQGKFWSIVDQSKGA